MAIAVQGTFNGHSSGSVTSYTLSVTVGAGTNRGLVVHVATIWNATIRGVTFGGVPLTQIGQAQTGSYRNGVYALFNPSVSTADVVVDIAASQPVGVCAHVLTGYGDAHNFTNTDGNSTTPSLTVTSATGELVLDMVASQVNNQTFAVGAGQTSLHEEDSVATTDVKTASSSEAGAASVTMSWTLGTSGVWWAAGVSVLDDTNLGTLRLSRQAVEAWDPPDATDVSLRLSRQVIEVWDALEAAPPGGGGEVPPGVNPDAGNLPTNFPLRFIEVRIGGVVYYYAETQLNDNDTWTDAPGKKTGRLKQISKVRRELSNDGAFIASRCSVTLADTDRVLRAFTALRGVYVALWVVDDATRRAEGAPFRYWSGLVVDYEAADDFTVTLHLEDVMGRRLSEYNKQPELPPDKFTTADFPAINPAADGRSIPLVLGLVSDAAESAPQGVIPAMYVGYLNFQTAWGGTNTTVDVYLWSQGTFPSGGVFQVYYNDEATPEVRQVVPLSAWGSVVWMEGYTGYGDTGLLTIYADYLNRRYASPLFVLRSHALAEAARNGQILVAGNITGIAETATGGNSLDSPVKIWQFLLVNYVFNRYTNQASYFTIPTLDGTYSIIDTDTVDAAHALLEARLTGGYLAGFMLGRGGTPQTVFDALAELSKGCDFDWGINRHGQLIVSVEDLNATPAITFTSQSDIEDGTYRVWQDTNAFINRVEHRYGYRYIPPVSPSETPAAGEPMPPPLPPEFNEWRSGLQVTESTASQSLVGEIATYTLDNYATQHTQTATDVASRVLNRGLGPDYDGPRRFSFTTGWGGFGTDANPIELGSVIGITHPARLGASATAVDTVRVTVIEVDPMRDRVTLEGYVMAESQIYNSFEALFVPEVSGDGGQSEERDDSGGGEIVSGQSLA